MSKAVLIVRLLLGVAFLVFGLNGFLHFFAPPPPAETAAANFGAALAASGYIMPMMSAVEVLAALMLLSGRLVPLALTLLMPILVNIVAFHVALDMAGIGLGAFLTVLNLFLAWAYRDSFLPMLDPRAKPTFAASA
jgi:uncharacterized membrane protein YphA (DoxX/SURF4 family)